jgi:nucleotidyltransferase substrate binding protein (TIGR01987 family)
MTEPSGKNTLDIRWQQRFANYQMAVAQLKRFMQKNDLNELEEQGLIQCFEYTHELAWKTLKDFLENSGTANIFGSRDATREAFALGLIEDGDAWMDMIKDRNQTSHTYNSATVKAITKNITQRFFNAFIALEQKLQSLQNVV